MVTQGPLQDAQLLLEGFNGLLKGLVIGLFFQVILFKHAIAPINQNMQDAFEFIESYLAAC